MHRIFSRPALLWLLAGLLLGACTSSVPPLIRQAPPDNPTLAAVNANAESYLERQVRWGGRLIAVENRVDATWLTVLEQPLQSDGEPEETDTGGGRFIAIVPAFLDPDVYAAGRLVTVTGNLARIETRKVGEYPYRYPVVQAQEWYLWPEKQAGYPYYGRRYDPWYGPWWYDPWFDPWWYRPWYGSWYYNQWYRYGNHHGQADHKPSWKPVDDCSATGCGNWHNDTRPPRKPPTIKTPPRNSGWTFRRDRTDRAVETTQGAPRSSGGWRFNRVTP